jgi:hypothetical protein
MDIFRAGVDGSARAPMGFCELGVMLSFQCMHGGKCDTTNELKVIDLAIHSASSYFITKTSISHRRRLLTV